MQNGAGDRTKPQPRETMPTMSPDNNEINSLAVRDLEEVPFQMSPAGLDRNRDFFRRQKHRQAFSQVAFERILNLFRIFG